MKLWPFGKSQEDPAMWKEVQSLSPEKLRILEDYIPGFDHKDPKTFQSLSQTADMMEGLKELAQKAKEGTDSMKNYWVAAAYAALYTKVNSRRVDCIKEVDRMKSFYLVDVILNEITNDSLAPDIHTGNVLTLFSDKKDINKELKELEETLSLDSMCETITPDMLAYGDYILSTRVDKIDGLTAICDDVIQERVIPLVDFKGIQGYLVQSEGKLRIAPPSEFITFSLPGNRLRLDLEKELGSILQKQIKEEDYEKIPKFARMGKSVIYPVISKIKELELLEQLVPATKLSKLAGGTIVGVQVPSGYDVEKGFNAAKRIESLINKRIGVDERTADMSIENILASTGRIKVVPLFGDKGQLQKLDYKSDEPDDLLNSVRESRSTILSSIGVPYEIIFGSDGDTKGQLLKKYARYLRILKKVQKAIAEAVKQIAYIHLTNKGIVFEEKDVQVSFINKLIEIDNIDKLEFADTTVNFIENVRRFVFELAAKDTSPIAGNVNLAAFVEFLNTNLRTVGLGDVVFVSKDGELVDISGDSVSGADVTPDEPDETKSLSAKPAAKLDKSGKPAVKPSLEDDDEP